MVGGALGWGAAHRPVRPHALVLLVAVGCASHGLPGLHGYSILVEEKDPQSVELARALREHGVKVKSHLKGGSGRTAALIYFTFSDPDAPDPETTWLHLRLADTRSGVIVRSSAIPLDSATATPRTRAEAAVRALLAP